MSGQKQTQQKEQQSLIATEIPLGKGHQENLLNSGEQQNALNKHWLTPTNARELAIQANKMATMLLNNEVDMGIAQKYSALVRGISQLMSIEVAKARLEKTKINLDLTDK